MSFAEFSPSASLQDLADTLLTMQSSDEIVYLLADMCSEPQLQTLAERWEIAKLIHMGFSYRMIVAKTGASTSTIARVAGKMQRGRGMVEEACEKRAMLMARSRCLPLLLKFHSLPLSHPLPL